MSSPPARALPAAAYRVVLAPLLLSSRRSCLHCAALEGAGRHVLQHRGTQLQGQGASGQGMQGKEPGVERLLLCLPLGAVLTRFHGALQAGHAHVAQRRQASQW